jgi:PPOX class probable F420-dependent enzyme
MSDHLTERVWRFLEAPRYAAIATAGADGAPHQTFAWYRLDPDGSILLNSRAGRRWPTDLRRDGRVSLAIADAEDQLCWVGVSGVVTEIDDDVERARDDIVALAHRYAAVEGGPKPSTIAKFRTQARVTFRVRITGIHDHLEED